MLYFIVGLVVGIIIGIVTVLGILVYNYKKFEEKGSKKSS